MKEFFNRFLIIGAGPVGLGMAKALKDAGVPYDQVDADTDVGGNWKHGVYTTAHIISSRKTTEYADFPMPEDYPDFPSRLQMYEYLRSYAETFSLRENIEFETKVLKVLPLENELWEIELESGEKRIYKGVMVCNGHHWRKRFPTFEGEFAGEYFHSKDYKNPNQLKGKRVLIIGGGNSACDVASEAARVGKSCDLSLRRGYWFLPKTLFGKPVAESPLTHFPVFVQRFFLKLLLRAVLGKYEDYGLPQPDHKIFERHPTLNSELLHYLKHGKISVRPDILRFEGNTVHFVGGERAEFDTVVCGTGFFVSFPFLPENLVPVKHGNLAMLYAGCVLPEYKNLYIIGTQQPRYGFGPLITPSTKLIAQMVKMQDEMELPIGLVLKESGAKLPETHLVNPIQAIRQMKIAEFLLPRLVKKERKLRKKFEGKRNLQRNFSFENQTNIEFY